MHEAIEFAQVQAQALKELCPQINKEGAQILDFGCGNGLLTYYVQELFWHTKVMGIDANYAKIVNAQKEYPTIEFFNETELNQFERNSFDLIYAAQVLHHIPKSNQQQIIEQLVKLFKPNGFLVIFELNPWNLATQWNFKKDKAERGNQLISSLSLNALLRNYGKTKLQFYNALPSTIMEFNITCTLNSYLPWGNWYSLLLCKR